MLILALDTTTRAGSVAVARGDVVVHEQSGDPATTHAQRLPTDVMTACAAAGVRIADVDLFAVAAGPGSFTGLRIGIATVQGLAMAWNRHVVPVSTLQAIAMAAPRGATRIAAWMDAHRGEVFAQVFDRGPDPSSAAVPVSDALAAAPQDALRAHTTVLTGAHFHGDGAVRYRDTIVAAAEGRVVVADAVPLLAGAIARLAALHADQAVAPHGVMPIYIRRPDVEVVREKRAGIP